MIKIKTQSNTVSITDTAVQATPLVEEEVGHINVKVSKVKMRTRSELATDNIYVTAKNMITLNQIHKGVDDAAVQIYPEPTIVAAPTLSGTYTYTGQEQAVTISTYDPVHIAVSGTTAATNAGTYTVVFSLIDTDADVWEDGTTEDKTATWTIGRQPVEIPTVYTGYIQTFDGYTHSPYIYYNGSSWSYYSFVNQYGDIVTVGGDKDVINVGEYDVTFDLVNTTNYMWSDGTVEQKSDTWEIEKAILDVPVAPADVSYDTYTHYAPRYSYNLVNTAGTTSATDVGTYTVTYTLKDTVQSEWSDGTTTQKSITWKIVKGQGNVNISTSITMDDMEKYLSYSRPTGTLTVSSSDSSKVTATLDTSAHRIYFKTISAGNVTVTVNIAGNSNAYAGTKTISVTNPAGLRKIANATNLSPSRYNLAGANIGNYALFAGGQTDDSATASSAVDAYNASLVRSTPTALSVARRFIASVTFGNYALFAGGGKGGTKARTADTMDAYNSSLTRSLPTVLSQTRDEMIAAKNKSYAIFAGGMNHDNDTSTGWVWVATVDAYNSSLTRSNPAQQMPESILSAGGTTVGSYALIECHGKMVAYNTSLTRSYAPDKSKEGASEGGNVGSYALFAGGFSYNSNVVDAYNSSLTHSLPTVLSSSRCTLPGVNYGSNVIFGGGAVDMYDASLTRTTAAKTSDVDHYGASAGNGAYILFAKNSTVNVYKNVA